MLDADARLDICLDQQQQYKEDALSDRIERRMEPCSTFTKRQVRGVYNYSMLTKEGHQRASHMTRHAAVAKQLCLYTVMMHPTKEVREDTNGC